MVNRINDELSKAMSESEWKNIPYDELLEHNPAKIREHEWELFNKEIRPEIPENLIVENIETEHHSQKNQITGLPTKK